MRVNVYAEEMTDRIEIISKEIDGHTFTGLRFYLELPVTLPNGVNFSGPFQHRPDDDDSAAVTFWGKRDLRAILRKALQILDQHYLARETLRADPPDILQKDMPPSREDYALHSDFDKTYDDNAARRGQYESGERK